MIHMCNSRHSKAKESILGKFYMTVIQAFIQHATLIKHYTANQTTLCPEAIAPFQFSFQIHIYHLKKLPYASFKKYYLMQFIKKEFNSFL